MIDVHSHILYGIDDGSSSLEESMQILKKMSEIGYTKVIATPHYIENTDYMANNRKKKEILEKIKVHVKKENIPIEIFLGNEVFMDEDLFSKLRDQEIYTLNNTSYLLLELPRFEKIDSALDILYEFNRQGVVVVLAHPERYEFFQKDKRLIDKYLENGVLLQGNLDALAGKYGKKAKKVFLQLLKEKKYFVLASDVHSADSSFFKKFKKLRKKLLRYVEEDYIEDLLVNHPEMIVKGLYFENEEE